MQRCANGETYPESPVIRKCQETKYQALHDCLDKYFCMKQNVGQLESRRNRLSRKQTRGCCEELKE